VVLVHAGKGKKDRVVPVSERALQWLQRYLDDVRPHYLFGQVQPALWLGYVGERLGETYIGETVHRYVLRSKVRKAGGCHLFRHTLATLMLENGADVRFIQAMLGHANLETTQIYTRVSIGKLKEVHNATHPAQQGRRRARPGATAAAEANKSDGSGEPTDGTELEEPTEAIEAIEHTHGNESAEPNEPPDRDER
jgi:integrase/recombinase XerD